jgi:hypothetical protein
MGEIKTAAQIAAEKIEQMGSATEEERLKWKYTPEGEKLGAKCLKDNCNIAAELNNYDEKAKKFVSAGAIDILVRSVTLPKNELAKRNAKKAMETIKTLKKDKVAVENVYSNIRRVFDHYTGQGEQQRKQVYEQVRNNFMVRLQQAAQQQGLGSVAGMDPAEIERQPQFREEWRKALIQMDEQYLKVLDEYKRELLKAE